ncbi:hypothetical protein P8C59_005071 [Phyllachora maydis]|uniref:5-formyltetrahydrofolate cyclo-ligase n=1 Tax=Phyllachora maydis TaxID=1825666 RepID=A0AAD9I4V3_9PEZI|nr:hypothetical protein P8C59_005071 [Phyllachora maydis]
MASLQALKHGLRSRMKERLRAVSPEAIKSQSSTVQRLLRDFRPYRDARRVGIFLSMPAGEIQTDGIVRDALLAGKEVFVPYLHANPDPSPELPGRLMDMVRLVDVRDYEALRPDRWGIPSLDPATVCERQRVLGRGGGPDPVLLDLVLLDLVLVPGLAFDRSPEDGTIRRLGHGKAFYDYFIRRHQERAAARPASAASAGATSPSARLYALALSEQFLASPAEGSVPVGPFDQRLDGLVLGHGQIIERASGTTD